MASGLGAGAGRPRLSERCNEILRTTQEPLSTINPPPHAPFESRSAEQLLLS